MITTKRLALRPLGRDDDSVESARRILTDDRCSIPFKWHGATPNPEEFADDLFLGLLIGFLAVGRADGVPRGVTLLSSPDLRDGHAFFSVAADPAWLGTGIMMEASVAALEAAFRSWPFHKIYADVDEVALHQFSTILRRGAEVEGRFGEHLFRAGRRFDVVRLAIYRDVWEASMRKMVSGLGVCIPER